MIIITIRLDSQQNQLQFIVDFLHFSLWFFFTVFSFFGLSSIDLRMTITVRIFESLPVSGPQSFIHCPFLDLFYIFWLFFQFCPESPSPTTCSSPFSFFSSPSSLSLSLFQFCPEFPTHPTWRRGPRRLEGNRLLDCSPHAPGSIHAETTTFIFEFHAFARE